MPDVIVVARVSVPIWWLWFQRVEVNLAELVLEGVQIDALLCSIVAFNITFIYPRSFKLIDLLTRNLLLDSGRCSLQEFLFLKRGLIIACRQLLLSTL